MSQPTLRPFPRRANEPEFLGIPPELRLIIYEYVLLAMTPKLSWRSRYIDVRFCCKTYEYKPHTNTRRRQRSTGLMTILHLCQKIRYEAEPLFYAQFMFVVNIKPHLTPLDLFGDVGYRLSHARTLDLFISNATSTCSLLTYHPEHDLRSVSRKRRRESWDGGSSLEWEIGRTHPRTAFQRTRRKSWAGCAPPWRSSLDRLDALLDFLNLCRSLRRLHILVSGVKDTLDDRVVRGIRNHLQAWFDFGGEFSSLPPYLAEFDMWSMQSRNRKRRGRSF